MGYEYGILDVTSKTARTDSSFEMGYAFTVNEDINVCGLRIMFSTVQTQNANLWDSNGNLLATISITSVVGEWVEALFENDVVLKQGKTYVVSSYNENGRYNATGYTINSKITLVNSRYSSTKGAFPTNTQTTYIYPLVDIIISSYEERFLIRVGNEIYTKVDNRVTSLGEVEVTSELFLASGFEDAPTSNDLIGFENPEVLLWNNSEDNVHWLTATVKAIPKNNQQIITNAIDLTHSSITGIENAVADCDGELVIAVSFDNKQTWKAWNGETWSLLSEEFSGMSKETLESITLDQWNLVYSGATSMYLKVSFLDTTQVIRTITIDFAN